MILSNIKLKRPISFGFGVEVWIASIGDHPVAVRRYFGPSLEQGVGIVPDASTLFRINHLRIQRLLWSGTDPDGTLVQVSDWVEGESLRTLSGVPGVSPLTPADLAPLLADGLSALKYLHQDCACAPLLHGDISPANLIVGDSGDRRTLTLVDVRGLPVGRHVSGRPDVVLGTLHFMPDEVLRGEPLAPAAEIWSLALAIATAFGAALPWKKAATPNAVLEIRQKTPVADLLKLTDGIDDGMLNLLGHMLAPDAADRPSAGQALAGIKID